MNAHPLLIPVGALIASLALSGCASTPRAIDIQSSPIEKPTLSLPKPDVLKLREVKWIVVNRQNVDQVFADLQKKGNSLVLFALTSRGYEAISLNHADLRKLVMQQQAIIGAYEEYYQKSQKVIDDANKRIK